ncbi:MAG: transglutaminase domain-containing protein [Bacteroidia bacterium]
MISGQASLAQETHIKHIPYFRSLNPSTLATRLTRNVKSDSEKVRIIHDWIAANIKYDSKKWLSYDYYHVPIKKILWRRKAICVGYSELFASLCFYAGVNCVTVPGYDKDITMNQGNNFYFDEHEWNAVHVESGWKLVDVCWDAGRIKITKRTFEGFFIYIFSGGKKDIRVYSPHFVKGASETYCMRDGKFFRTDHLPSDPIWQLQYPTESVQQFISDSSYYYKKYDSHPDSSDKFTENEAKRMSFLNKNDNDRQLENAMQGYRNNSRNQYEACIAYNIMASDLVPLMAKTADTAGMALLCDSALNLLNKAIAHSDSMRTMIGLQKRELTASSIKKRNILNRQNAALVTSSNSVLKALNAGKSSAMQNERQLNSAINSRNGQLKLAYKSKAFYNKKPAPKPMKLDSIGYAVSIRVLSDSIAREHKRLQAAFTIADSLYIYAEKRRQAYSANIGGITINDCIINFLRWSYFDDLDYEIRKPKDTLVHNKYRNDSLLLTKKGFVYYPLFEEFNRIKEGSATQMKLYKIKLQLLEQMKSTCADGSALEVQYRKTLDDMSGEAGFLNNVGSRYAAIFDKLHNELNDLVSGTKKERTAYQYEKKTEQYFSFIRRQYINNHANGLQNGTKNIKKVLRDDRKSVLAYMKLLKKKAKK